MLGGPGPEGRGREAMCVWGRSGAACGAGAEVVGAGAEVVGAGAEVVGSRCGGGGEQVQRW